MTKFHEGQEVEVFNGYRKRGGYAGSWRKAKIIRLLSASTATFDQPYKWQVQFTDSSRDVCDEAHIRVAEPIFGGPSFGGR